MNRNIWIQAATLVALALPAGHALSQDGIRAVYTGTAEERQTAAQLLVSSSSAHSAAGKERSSGDPR